MPEAANPHRRGAYRWLLGQLPLRRSTAVAIVAAAIAATVGSVCAPLLYARITDLIVHGTQSGSAMDWPLLWWLVAVQALVYLGVYGSTVAQGWLLTSAVAGCAYTLRRRIEDKIHRMPVDLVASSARGSVISKVTAHTDNATTAMTPMLVTLPTSLLTVCAVTILLFTISPQLAIIALSAAPVSAVVAVIVARRARPHLQRQWDATADLTAHVEESLSVRRTITAYQAQPLMTGRFDTINDRLFGTVRRAQWISGSLGPLVTAVNALVFLALAFVGSLQVINGSISLGETQAAILFAQQLSTGMRSLAGVFGSIQSGAVSASSVRDLLEAPDEEDDDPTPVPDRRDLEPSPAATPRAEQHRAPPQIELRGVGFGYQTDTPVLHSVDLTLQPGTTTALVGSTGSGKTTLVRLLQRFRTPDSGSILIDGRDVSTRRRDETRALMAVVPQEPWLFAGTIGDNIDFGRNRDSGQTASDPALTGHLAELVAALPDGLDTRVGDDASELSVGEKQLATIARAIAASPRILILDEATSHADPRTELLIQQALNDLRRHTTALVITHRPATAARADVIAVLDGGRVVEAGTHQELLRHNGAYADWWRLAAHADQNSADQNRTESGGSGDQIDPARDDGERADPRHLGAAPVVLGSR